jgi:lipopolysaccharide biosynthesis regulator YciM
MPALSLQEWQTQKERLTLWQELGAKTTAAPREGDAKRVSAALDTAEGQSAYLNEDYERAFGAFKRAHARDESYLPATFGLLNALYRHSSGIAGWEKVLEDAKKSVGSDAALGAFLPVYRAAFLSRAGERDKAAAMLGEVLGIAAER